MALAFHLGVALGLSGLGGLEGDDAAVRSRVTMLDLYPFGGGAKRLLADLALERWMATLRWWSLLGELSFRRTMLDWKRRARWAPELAVVQADGRRGSAAGAAASLEILHMLT